MRKVLALALLALLCALPARAQVGNTTTILFPGAPSGACAPLSFAVNTATGALYDCVASAWTLVSGGAGGISISANQLAGGSGTNTIGAVGSWVFGEFSNPSFIDCPNDDNCSLGMTDTAMDSAALFPGGIGLAKAGTTNFLFLNGTFTLGGVGAGSGTEVLQDNVSGLVTLGEVEGKEFNVNGAGIMSSTSSNTDLNGTVTNSGGTGTYSFTRTFSIAPICIARDETTLANLLTVSVNTTGVTATTTGMTDHWSYICIGRN